MLRTFRGEDILGSYPWAQCNHQNRIKREAREVKSERRYDNSSGGGEGRGGGRRAGRGREREVTPMATSQGVEVASRS